MPKRMAVDCDKPYCESRDLIDPLELWVWDVKKEKVELQLCDHCVRFLFEQIMTHFYVGTELTWALFWDEMKCCYGVEHKREERLKGRM